MIDKGFSRKIALRGLLYMLAMSSGAGDERDVSTMQGWTHCSKPTVLKELHRLEKLGLVVKSEKQHRPNAKKFFYYVPDSAYSSKEYQSSKHSYSVYKTNILGIK